MRRNLEDEIRGLVSQAIGRHKDEEALLASYEALTRLREVKRGLRPAEVLEFEEIIGRHLRESVDAVFRLRAQGPKSLVVDWQETLLRLVVVAAMCIASENPRLITEALRQLSKVLQAVDEGITRFFPALIKKEEAPLVDFFAQ